MRFSKKEMIAILKMGYAMVMADGRVDQNETAVMTLELMRFGVPKEDVKELLQEAGKMETPEALAILTALDAEQKKYVSSYLGTIMASDEDIDDKEMALWQLVSTLCGFPQMTLMDALNNMTKL